MTEQPNDSLIQELVDGGDLCVCHHHGEVECYGCEDCEGADDDEW